MRDVDGDGRRGVEVDVVEVVVVRVTVDVVEVEVEGVQVDGGGGRGGASAGAGRTWSAAGLPLCATCTTTTSTTRHLHHHDLHHPPPAGSPDQGFEGGVWSGFELADGLEGLVHRRYSWTARGVSWSTEVASPLIRRFAAARFVSGEPASQLR